MVVAADPLFFGVWRLSPVGGWGPVGATPTIDASMHEATLEMLATLAQEALPTDGEVTAEIGALVVEIRRDEGGVLVGLRREGGNPLLVRTALRRADLASRRGPSGSVATETTSVAGTSWRAAPEPPVLAVVPSRRIRLSSSESGDVDAFDPMRGDELAWELDVEAAANGSPLPQGGAAPVAGAPMADAATWGHVEDWMERAIAAGATFVGRTVSANYWREAMRSHAHLGARVRVDVRGEVAAQDPAAVISTRASAALCLVARQVEDRCARVVPDASTRIFAPLGAPPWVSRVPNGGSR